MQLRNITFAFEGQTKPLFNNLNLTVPTGKLVALCGDNGVGKSTLLRILRGQIQGQSLTGSIVLDDIRYSVKAGLLPTTFTSQIRLVQQDVDTMLADQLTAHQNLQLANIAAFPTLNGLPKINIAALQKQLPFDLTTPVHELSGGQRQLLAIAMALQHNTRVLLLDEPTAALDKRNAHTVMKTLRKIAREKNTIVLIVCHNQQLVNQYADEQIILPRA